MGNKSSKSGAKGATGTRAVPGPTVEGKQVEVVLNTKFGIDSTELRWVVDDITSTAEVKKEKKPDGSETWGPYKKQYTKTLIGQEVWTQPNKIDNILLLCDCKDIFGYLNNLSHPNDPNDNVGTQEMHQGAQPRFQYILKNADKTMCWSDESTAFSGNVGSTYNVILRHPDFKKYGTAGTVALGVKFFGGKKTKKQLKSKKNRTVKTKK